MPPPTTSAPKISARPVPTDDWAVPAARNSSLSLTISASVVTTAMAMPIMPKVLPLRAEAGCDRPLSAWMKQTDATRYSSVTRFMLTSPVIVPPPCQPASSVPSS
ncbi:hypothetical protein D3C85_1402640 [compost metagenome]